MTRAEHIARVRSRLQPTRIWEKPLNAPWLRSLDPNSKLTHWIGIQINKFIRGDWGDTPADQAFKNNLQKHRNTDNYHAQYRMENGQWLRISQGRYTGLCVWIGAEIQDPVQMPKAMILENDRPHHIYHDDGDLDIY